MFAILCGVAALFAVLLLFAALTYASVLVITAAPFCLAVLFSFTSVKYNHWALFAFLIIVLYSLASYPKIRKAVTFVSISIMGAFLCSLITMFFSKQLPDSKFLLAIIRLLMLIVCIVMSMRFDAEKVNPFCINIARYIKLPILIQRLISSVICGIGVFFMVTITFIDFFKTPYMQNVVGIILLIGGSVAAYCLDKWVDTPAFEASTETCGNELPEASDTK